MRFQLAEVLHKTLEEIDAMSVDQFHGWIAYFRHKTRMRDK